MNKVPKRNKLTAAVKGMPDHSNEAMLAKMAEEIWNANQNTLVAHWIKEHPGVPSDQISLLQWTDSEGVHFKVVHKSQISVEPATPEPQKLLTEADALADLNGEPRPEEVE